MLVNISARVIFLGLVVASFTSPALLAQTPSPKKEAELVAAGNKALTGPQISALLVGNTAQVTFLAPVGRAPAGTQFMIFYRDAKTRVVGPVAGSAAFKKTQANWWTEGNHLCAEAQITKEGHFCWSLYRISSDVYQCDKGNCSVVWRVVPGNPGNL